jgi:hypothetical protein
LTFFLTNLLGLYFIYLFVLEEIARNEGFGRIKDERRGGSEMALGCLVFQLFTIIFSTESKKDLITSSSIGLPRPR